MEKKYTITLTSADARSAEELDTVWSHLVGELSRIFQDFNEMSDFTVKFTSEKAEA